MIRVLFLAIPIAGLASSIDGTSSTSITDDECSTISPPAFMIKTSHSGLNTGVESFTFPIVKFFPVSLYN
jgi:hypothetical protein